MLELLTHPLATRTLPMFPYLAQHVSSVNRVDGARPSKGRAASTDSSMMHSSILEAPRQDASIASQHEHAAYAQAWRSKLHERTCRLVSYLTGVRGRCRTGLGFFYETRRKIGRRQGELDVLCVRSSENICSFFDANIIAPSQDATVVVCVSVARGNCISGDCVANESSDLVDLVPVFV